jgi:hypothetical protein
MKMVVLSASLCGRRRRMHRRSSLPHKASLFLIGLGFSISPLLLSPSSKTNSKLLFRPPPQPHMLTKILKLSFKFGSEYYSKPFKRYL